MRKNIAGFLVLLFTATVLSSGTLATASEKIIKIYRHETTADGNVEHHEPFLGEASSTIKSSDLAASKTASSQALVASPVIVKNGDLETAGTGGLPQSWSKKSSGNNTVTFKYPSTGAGGSKGAKITISKYKSGEAKWYFASVSLQTGMYTYTDQYSSTIPSTITLELTKTNGSVTTKDIKSLSASTSFVTASVDFTIDSTVKSVSVYHRIKAIGSMTVDNIVIAKKETSGSIFATGAVTLRFDDGLATQYANAVPKIKSAGLHGTFYVISQDTADLGDPTTMSKAQVKQLYADGNEIGSHTQTHPHLPELSTSKQKTEIEGSRNDLLAWNVGPILSFAYPYGEYNQASIDAVKNAGFTSATATIDGYVTPSSDHYQLEYQEVVLTTKLAEVQGWVNSAATNKKWLILTFHDVATSTDEYSTSPATFNSIIDYIKQKGIPVVTVSQGMTSMQ